jgi:hypothetical protein
VIVGIPAEATVSAGELYQVAFQTYLGIGPVGQPPIGPGHPRFREGRHERSALVSVMFSAISVEAFLNETPELAEDSEQAPGPHPPAVRAFAAVLREAEDSYASTLLKANLARLTLSGTAFERGAQPFQDFALLMRVRDELVHLKPTGFTSDDGTRVGHPGSGSAVLKHLKSKNVLMEPEVEEGERPEDFTVSARFISMIGTPAMARWACLTTATMVHEIISIAPDGEFKAVLRRAYEENFRKPV